MSATASVAFDETQPGYTQLFNDDVFEYIQREVLKITNLKLKKPYLVPLYRIKEVMDTVWSNFRPNTGSIYTRYMMDNTGPYRIINYNMDMVKQVINIVVNDILNTVGIYTNNMEYSVWNTLSGNSRGMVNHPKVKLNERRPAMHFNMNF